MSDLHDEVRQLGEQVRKLVAQVASLRAEAPHPHEWRSYQPGWWVCARCGIQNAEGPHGMHAFCHHSYFRCKDGCVVDGPHRVPIDCVVRDA